MTLEQFRAKVAQPQLMTVEQLREKTGRAPQTDYSISKSNTPAEYPDLTPKQTAKEKYGDTLYVPASPFAVENERRNKLNYIVNDNYKLTKDYGMNNPYSQLDYINENERLVISDFVAQRKYDSAYNYLDYISPELDKRQAESEYKQVKSFAEKHPVIAAATDAFSTPFKTAEYGVNIANYRDNKLRGKSTDFDSNSSTFSTSRYSEAVTDGIMKNDGIIGQIVKGGMKSAANQYAVSKVVGAGPLTELLLAGRAAQDSLYQNAKGGVDGDKSVVNSLGKAAISYRTNRYFPSEKLMVIKVDDMAQTLWQSFKTASLSEGVEEVAENIITNIWDTAQLGDQSEISQLIKSYQEQGYSKTSAVVKTVVEKYVLDSVIGFLTGAISGGVTAYGANKVNTLKQTLTDGDRLGIIHKDFLPLINENESNNGHSDDNKEDDLYYKAYSDDIKKKVAEDIRVNSDSQQDKTSTTDAPLTVEETEEEFLERINKEAYTNRRWAVETPNLLSKEQYNDYLEIKKGKITGERVWQINDLLTNEHLVRIDDWLILSKNDFADAPITALYKVSENHRQKI